MSNKPINPDLPKVTPPLYLGQRLTPFFFDESATITEQMYMFCHSLKELIEHVNSYDEFANEVMEYLKHIDSTIADTVLAKLTEWYNNGDLQTILEAVSQGYFDALGEELRGMVNELDEELTAKINAIEKNLIEHPRANQLSFVRRMRDINECRMSKVTTTGSHIGAGQGACVYRKNGSSETLSVCSAFNVYENSALVTDGIKLCNYSDLTDLSTKEVSDTVHLWGHGNGLTYNENEDCFYMAVGSASGFSGKTVHKISANLDSYESKVLPFHSTDIAYYNGDMYVIDDTTPANMKVYKLNWADVSNNDLVCTIHPNVSQPIYNFDIANGNIFLVDTEGRQIIIFDLETGEYIWTYHVPMYANDGYYRMGELESITVFEDGSMYLTCYSVDGLQQSQALRFEVFEANYLTNRVSLGDWRHTVFTETGGSTVYVKQSYEDNTFSHKLKCINANPNGSDSNPFETIAEAVSYIKANPNISHCAIKLKGNHRLYSAISCNKGLLIYGENDENREYYITGGFLLYDCLNIAFWYIHNYVSQNSTNHGLKGALYAFNSNVALYYCTMEKESTNVMYEASDAVRADYATVRYSAGDIIISYLTRESGQVIQANNTSGSVSL